MKRILLLFMAWATIATYADNIEQYLQVLDQEVEARATYQVKKEQRIDSLKMLLGKASDYEQRYDLLFSIFSQYQAYQLDSAAIFLKRAEVMAKQHNDSLRIIRAHLNVAPLFFQSGRYNWATDLLSDWRQAALRAPLDLRKEYFRLCVRVYASLLNNHVETFYEEHHARQLHNALDSLAKYDPDNWALQAERLTISKEYRKAIGLYHQHYSDDDRSPMAAITFYGMAAIYQKMGDKENYKKYLTLSAINDMRQATREYRSLSDLATLLYDEGDVQRATRYVHRALQDAMESKSGLRLLQNQKIYTVITDAYQQQQSHIRNLYRGVLALAALLLAMAAVGIVVLRRKNRQLRETSRMLTESNASLEALSNQRHNYITNFINLCQDYLEKMENHRKELSKVAARRNFDELYKTVKSTRYINQEINDFYMLFDEAFLNIYPDFIEKVNRLLRSEEQIVLEPDGGLSTEVRMLALLHLGRNDSADVARFLRCSHSTVYNYRTRMRNRAINRDTFEEDVMAI